jgi:hypothetical protein
MVGRICMEATIDPGGVGQAGELGGSEEDRARMMEYFGGLFTALVTLFESFSGGLDWGEVYATLRRADSAYGLFFLLYVYFNIVLVMNVVTGTVVDCTTRIANRDRDRMVADELHRVKAYMDDIEEFFTLADQDKSGQLSWEEFAGVLESDRMKAYFQHTLQLDVRQAHKLFTLLDTDCDGQVHIQEFLDGCVRLRGHASSFDLNIAIFQLEQLLIGTSCIERAVRVSAPSETTASYSESRISGA